MLKILGGKRKHRSGSRHRSSHSLAKNSEVQSPRDGPSGAPPGASTSGLGTSQKQESIKKKTRRRSTSSRDDVVRVDLLVQPSRRSGVEEVTSGESGHDDSPEEYNDIAEKLRLELENAKRNLSEERRARNNEQKRHQDQSQALEDELTAERSVRAADRAALTDQIASLELSLEQEQRARTNDQISLESQIRSLEEELSTAKRQLHVEQQAWEAKLAAVNASASPTADDDVSALRVSLAELKVRIASGEDDRQKTAQLVKALETEKAELISGLAATKMECAQLKNDLEEARRKEHLAATNMQQASANAAERLQSLTEELERARVERSATLQKAESDKQKDKDELTKALNAKSDLEQALSRTRETLKVLQEEFDETRNDKDRLETHASTMSRNLMELQDQLNAVTSDLSVTKTNYDKVIAEREAAEAALETSKKQVSVLNDQLQALIADRDGAHSSLTAVENDLRQQIVAAAAEIAAITRDRDALRTNLTRVERELVEAHTNCNELRAATKAATSTDRARIIELESERDECLRKLTEIERQQSQTAERSANFEREVESLRCLLKESVETIDNEKHARSADLVKKDREIQSLQEQLRTSAMTGTGLQEASNALHNQLRSLLRDKQDLERDAEDRKETWDRQKATMQKTLAALNDERDTLLQDAANNARKRKQLEVELEEVKGALAASVAAQTESKAHAEQAIHRISELEKTKTNLEQHLEDLEEQVEHLRQQAQEQEQEQQHQQRQAMQEQGKSTSTGAPGLVERNLAFNDNPSGEHCSKAEGMILANVVVKGSLPTRVNVVPPTSLDSSTSDRKFRREACAQGKQNPVRVAVVSVLKSRLVEALFDTRAPGTPQLPPSLFNQNLPKLEGAAGSRNVMARVLQRVHKLWALAEDLRLGLVQYDPALADRFQETTTNVCDWNDALTYLRGSAEVLERRNEELETLVNKYHFSAKEARAVAQLEKERAAAILSSYKKKFANLMRARASLETELRRYRHGLNMSLDEHRRTAVGAEGIENLPGAPQWSAGLNDPNSRIDVSVDPPTLFSGPPSALVQSAMPAARAVTLRTPGSPYAASGLVGSPFKNSRAGAPPWPPFYSPAPLSVSSLSTAAFGRESVARARTGAVSGGHARNGLMASSLKYSRRSPDETLLRQSQEPALLRASVPLHEGTSAAEATFSNAQAAF